MAGIVDKSSTSAIRAPDTAFHRNYGLPWTTDADQDRIFQRWLAAAMVLAFLLGIVWPFLPVTEREAYDVEEIPPRIAQLLLKERPIPSPPRLPDPMPEPQDPEPVQMTESPPTDPAPVADREAEAREQAQAALLPFTEDLASLAEHEVLEAVAETRPLAASVARQQRSERSMITSSVGTASGGINTASMSRNTGIAGFAARNATTVERPFDPIGDSISAVRRSGSSSRASRSREEIELVFDRNKGAIFALYNRALRVDATLAGKLVLRLTIAPSGEVTACEIVSSELGAPDLERKLLQRVMLFRFEAKDVEPVTTTKPIDFFPA